MVYNPAPAQSQRLFSVARRSTIQAFSVFLAGYNHATTYIVRPLLFLLGVCIHRALPVHLKD